MGLVYYFKRKQILKSKKKDLTKKIRNKMKVNTDYKNNN